jgi:hypothetical protein
MTDPAMKTPSWAELKVTCMNPILWAVIRAISASDSKLTRSLHTVHRFTVESYESSMCKSTLEGNSFKAFQVHNINELVLSLPHPQRIIAC